MQQLKIVAIGDNKVGKTSVLHRFTNQPLPKDYQETVQTSTADYVLKDFKPSRKNAKKVQLNFHDTSGQPSLVRMRTMCYNATNVFLLCFDVNERASFRNACGRWIEEAKAHQPGAKFILLGISWGRPQGGKDQGPVTQKEAVEILPKLGATAYFQVNPRSGDGVPEALEGLVDLALGATHGKRARGKHQVNSPSRGNLPGARGEDGEDEEKIAHVDIRQRDKKDVKLVVLGDSRVGKSALLYTYTQGKFPTGSYEPSVGGSEVFSPHMHTIHSAKYKLSLWDMGGNPEHRRLRYICFPDTDVVLLCFDISDPRTLDNCVRLWSDEVHNNMASAPVLLVGLKSDLRAGNADAVSEDAARAAQAKIPNCVQYVECSCKAYNRDQKMNIDQIFELAIASCVRVPNNGKSCIIL